MTIDDFQARAQDKAVDNIENAFDFLSGNINSYTLNGRALVALRARFNYLKKNRNSGDLPFAEEMRHFNAIMDSLIQLIGDLTAIDYPKSQVPKQASTVAGASFHGLIHGDFDEITREAIDKIKESNFLRVIGSARQHALSTKEIPVMEEYFTCIEERMARADRTSPFHYRRITAQDLKPRFKAHLDICLKHSVETGNHCALAFEQDINLSLTYFIVDESLLVFNLYKTDDAGVKDNAMTFKSYDPAVIRNFILHFNEAWDNAREHELIIDNPIRFHEVIPVNNKIYKHIQSLKEDLRNIPNNSIRMDHAEKELEQAVTRIEGLRNCKLVIEHKLTNGKLLSVFYRYINALGKGGKYSTISFFEFWKNLHTVDTFISAHENALTKGAEILRIYVVNEARIGDPRYVEMQREYIQANLRLGKKFPNFKFVIHFSGNYNNILQQHENFAIWERGHEYIVFFPDHAKKGDNIGETSLFFINTRDTNYPEYQRNCIRYERAKVTIESKLKECADQNKSLSEAQQTFLAQFR